MSLCAHPRISESESTSTFILTSSPDRQNFHVRKVQLSVVQLFYMLTKNAKKNWKVQNWVHICGVRYLSYNSTKIVYNTFWVFGTLLISVETLLEQTSWLARLLWHSSQAALIRGYSRAFLPLPFALPFGSSAFPLPLPFLAWIPHQSSKNHCLRSNLDFWSNKKRTSTKSFFNILISWIIIIIIISIVIIIIVIIIIIIWIIPADPCGQNGQHTQKQGFGCVEQSQAFWNAFWQVFFAAAAATTAARTTTAPPPAETATAVGKCFHTICIYFVEFMSLCQCHILSS